MGRMQTFMWFSHCRCGETCFKIVSTAMCVCVCACTHEQTCSSETVGWCQKLRKLPLEHQNKRQNPHLPLWHRNHTAAPPLHIWINKRTLSGWLPRACWLSVLTLYSTGDDEFLPPGQRLTSISAGRFCNICGGTSADLPWHCIRAIFFISAAICGC